MSFTIKECGRRSESIFEPPEEEREEGKKLPTKAHKGIARLVHGGYIRVIITTNFDHLLEDAIRDEGMEPVIISSPDSINGAIPIVHSKCTIIKVRGDYLDTRIDAVARLAGSREQTETATSRLSFLRGGSSQTIRSVGILPYI